jgi:GDP-4-dehydro-6-deoxy-D-mannose reductase
MKRVLIAGAAGFVGRHLADHLLAKGYIVFGFDHVPPSAQRSSRDVTYMQGDLSDVSCMKEVLESSQPDIVFHLAGVTKSNRVQELYSVNVTGTAVLLEAVKTHGIEPSIVVASSSAVYGTTPGRVPITERHVVRPVTHYGTSKAAQELVAHHAFLVQGLPIMCTRTFNLIGPGQPATFACSDFAHQIALAEMNKGKRAVETGNLNTRRDFIDVRDAVRAYDLLAERGKPGLNYNVCSGRSTSIGECLRILLGMAKIPLEVTTSQIRMQSDDIPAQVGSAARLHNRTGWKPEIPIQQSLKDLLEYWRKEAIPTHGED